jgi:hypothetical protein
VLPLIVIAFTYLYHVGVMEMLALGFHEVASPVAAFNAAIQFLVCPPMVENHPDA